MNYNQEKDIDLVVSSCDKYKSAWKPYFTLLEIYWKTHPENIYLISETETYSHEGLNIRVCNYGANTSWSERLVNTLKKLKVNILFLL